MSRKSNQSMKKMFVLAGWAGLMVVGFIALGVVENVLDIVAEEYSRACIKEFVEEGVKEMNQSK